MATPRTFDYDVLKQLIRENPAWSNRQLAWALTLDNRRTDPGSAPVSPSAVGSAKSRWRDAWEDGGQVIPILKHAGTIRTQPFDNLPKQWWNATEIDYLRILTRIERGDPDIPAVRRTGALNFAKRLEAERKVVDLKPSGEPYVRAARPDELDQEGSLIELYARFPGLTESQWRQLGTSEMRAVAAERFRGKAMAWQGPRR